MESAKKVVAIIFGISVIAFTFLAILGIWGVVDEDIAWKSVSTLGVVFLASLVSLLIMNNLSKKQK